MQIKEGGAVDVEEIVAVTMGPESAFRALHKAVSLGADRSVHLTDDVARRLGRLPPPATRWRRCSRRESPDLVLLGQQSDDGECYTIGAIVADHLQMPSLTQVIKIDVEDGKRSLRAPGRVRLRHRRGRAARPSSRSVTRSTSRATRRSRRSWARRRSSSTRSRGRRRHRRRQGRRGRLRTEVLGDQPAAGEAVGRDHRGRGHRRDGPEDRRLARGKEAVSDERDPHLRHSITRASSTRTRSAPSPRPPSSAGEIGAEAHAVVVGGGDLTDDLASRSASTARRRSGARRRPRASRAGGRRHGQAHRGQRLRLRAVRRRPARLRDRRRPRRPTGRRRDHGGHGREGRRTASCRRAADPPGLGDRRRRLRGRHGRDHRPPQRVRDRGVGHGRAEVAEVDVELSPWSTKATMRHSAASSAAPT